ncbi:MAG: hypothetical protein ACI93R_001573 [Flavobacteriales bacterium]|jgi:hypothetical protein
MKTLTKTLLASTIAAITFSNGVMAEESNTFTEAMKNGKASLNFRFRVEDVSQDGTDDATAQTLRARLNYKTGSFNGFSGFIEFDQVSELIEVDYSTPGNGRGTATIADPEGTDLNQAYVQYANAGTTFKYGRQRILLDNQRYVGGVGWRQNEQTFDALSVKNTSIDNLEVFYSYVHNVNTITGGDIDAKDHLLNAAYKFSDKAKVTGYGYFLDVTDADNASDDTLGVRFSGKAAQFTYSAEFARQSARKANQPDDYSASYTALKADMKTGPVKIGLGYEVLGADGTEGEFVTKYGTKHAFNGWSDKFLVTPAGGLKDLYASVSGKFGGVTAAAIYHTFSADDSTAAGGIDDFGSELDFVVKGKAGSVGWLVKYANYSADDLATDTSKIWLMASTKF